MSKKMRVGIVLIIVLSLFSGTLLTFLFGRDSPQICVNKEALPYTLGNQQYCLLLADEEQEWAQGLMNYRKPLDFDGMLFVFPDKKYRSFWNQNTYLDLDIYWISDGKIVGESFLPSIEKSSKVETVTSPVPIDRVVEIIR